MRQTFLLLFITIFLTTGTKSQSLVDTNKVWSVAYWMNFGGCETISYKFNGDTIIGPHEYKKLFGTSDSTLKTNWFYTGAMREELSRRVYYMKYQNQDEFLLYDFGLKKKDTFATFINDHYIKMVVDSVDTITLLNNEARKRFFILPIGGPGYEQKWIEGIGSLNGLLYMNNYGIDDVWDVLICLKENDTLKYHNSNYTSCYLNSTGIKEIISSSNHKIYPNPFFEFTTLSFKNPNHENHSLTIYNSIGQVMRKNINICESEIIIERGSLENGFYFFQLINEKRIVAEGKLLIQ